MRPSPACSTRSITATDEPEPQPPGRGSPRASPRHPSMPRTEQELDRLAIEDSVIRDLARSLQPQRR